MFIMQKLSTPLYGFNVSDSDIGLIGRSSNAKENTYKEMPPTAEVWQQICHWKKTRRITECPPTINWNNRSEPMAKTTRIGAHGHAKRDTLRKQHVLAY